MKVLVACEFSGRVRDAFLARGHDALSCDILPTESPGPHYQGDVLTILNEGWDLMIAHPPCTYLANSGLHWNQRIPGRFQYTDRAAEFFLKLWNAPIDKIMVENPVGAMSTRFRKPDQYIQPWEYGHPATKRTCLWLKNLPLLVPTNILPPDQRKLNLTPGGHSKVGYLPYRDEIRSLTYEGWAEAFANQWG